jgi:hypothetical protein
LVFIKDFDVVKIEYIYMIYEFNRWLYKVYDLDLAMNILFLI